MDYEFTLNSPGGELEASFIPSLGMIGTSLRHRGEELLYQGHGLAAYVGQGSVFALPLLHPWANRLSEWEFELAGQRVVLDPDSAICHRDGATGAPIHGLLAASPHWSVSDTGADRLTAELDFGAVPEYMAAFPFAHRLSYRAVLGDGGLRVELTVTASGDRPVPIAFGFHPYLALPGCERGDWELTLAVARQVVVDERMIPTGETVGVAPGALDGRLADRSFDTGFRPLTGAPPIFAVADARRRISVRFARGYPAGQVYSAEGGQFICYEPMTAPTNALISGDGLRWVDPGAEFTAAFEIAVESLS
ncbi:MAG: aldose 1-epimerase [Solirubrobacteraceae bacterium]